uniref:F-box/WD repeat-containing protein 7 n=1 Tax=Ascaris suum TaxID=6253 RepID=F1KUI7_ASCSU
MADGSALCSQLIQNVDDVDAASSEVRNTSFPGPSSYELRGNRRRSASAACVRLEEDRLRCPQHKRKSSLFNETFKEKKPALIHHSPVGGMDVASTRSEPSESPSSSKSWLTKLPQCDGFRRFGTCKSVSEVPYFSAHDGSAKYLRDLHMDGDVYRIDSPISPEEKEIEDEEEDQQSMEDECIRKHDADVVQWVNVFKRMPACKQMDALSELVDECSLTHVRHLQSVIEPFFQKDFIHDLPKEIALHVMGFLSAADIARISLTCRYWRTLAEDSRLWKEKCREINVTEMEKPSERRSGAWAETACTSGIEIVGYHAAPNDRYSFVHGCHPHAHRHCCDVDDGPKNVCLARSKWKAMYLRHQRVQANWRSRPLTGSCILKGHEEHVITCLQIHGDLIVTGSDDNTLKVWSASKAICLHTLIGHTGGVWSSQMSECGSIIVSGSTDRTVRVWSVETGCCLHNLQGHTSTVRCMSLKGSILVSGSRDTTIRVWDIENGECIRILYGHVAAVRCVQFDGVRIVSGAYDYSVKVWDAETGSCLHTLTGHSNRVYSLLFDSERDIVVSGSLDTTIRVWNIREGVCTQTLIGHQSLTSGMQLRGNILVSGNADSTIKVWDITDGQCKYTLSGPNRHASAVTSLQFLENGLVATSSDDGSVKLWDVRQGTFVRDLVRLRSGGSGGCIWRLKSTPTMLVCAVGSRNGTEDTKLILLNFDADYP